MKPFQKSFWEENKNYKKKKMKKIGKFRYYSSFSKDPLRFILIGPPGILIQKKKFIFLCWKILKKQNKRMWKGNTIFLYNKGFWSESDLYR